MNVWLFSNGILELISVLPAILIKINEGKHDEEIL